MAGNPITRIIITAKDEASAVFGSLQAKVAGIAAAISGYFGARMFGDALGSARDFEAAMSRVQAASGASGAELAALKAAAEQAGLTTKYSATEAAGALENLAKAGLTSAQAVQSLPAVLQLASAGGVELGTAAEYITKAVNGMGLAFSEAGRVADVLAMGANASNTSVEGLAGALSYAAPLAQSLGLSLEQTVAIIGKFADAGIDASRAGTALNAILAQFSDPASKFRQELANAGIVTTNFDQALRQLAAAGPAGQKAINAVGQEAGPALRALLNQGIGALDDLKGKLDNAKGSAAEVAATMSQNLDGSIKGLSSAWDGLRRALVAPLLEPLAAQITALSARFRAAVADGTVAKFGETIRVAFESGAKFVTEFMNRVDFGAVIARMQAFAERTGEIFRQVGEGAGTAANVIQTAYGVMSAGANTVMAVIYKISEAFAGVVSNVLNGIALLNEGMAKITFGGVAERYRAVAAEIREAAGGLWAVSEGFAAKSTEAFTAAATGAETAANGWAKITTSAQEAAPAVQQVGDAVRDVGDQAAASTGKLVEFGDAAKAAAAKQSTAADESRQKVADLRAEYERLKAAGDTQGMAEKMQQLNELLGKTGTAAGEMSKDVVEAFAALGVQSQREAAQLAENAKRSFETIRDSGVATPRDIQNAFTAYAQKAIAANGGVADSILQAQAAQVGLKVEADASGKAIVLSMDRASASTSNLGKAADDVAAKFGAIGAAAEEASESVAEASQTGGVRSLGARDPFAEAMRRGLVDDPMIGDEFRQAFNAFFAESMAKMKPLSTADYFRKVDFAESDALRRAAEFATEQKRKDDAGGVQTKRYEVRVRIGGSSRTIEAASEADARELIETLQELERRSA